MPNNQSHQYKHTFTRDTLAASLSLASLLEEECWAILEILQSHPFLRLRRNYPSICGDDDLFRFRTRATCPSSYRALLVRALDLRPIFYKSIDVGIHIDTFQKDLDRSLEVLMGKTIHSNFRFCFSCQTT